MIVSFLKWYFWEVPAAIAGVWGNYLWFFPRYFYMGRMLKEFFAPWRGIVFRREKRSFEIGDAFSAWFGNAFSGFMGAIGRSILIATGLAVEILALFFGVLAYAGWVLFIPAIFYCLINGIAMLV